MLKKIKKDRLVMTGLLLSGIVLLAVSFHGLFVEGWMNWHIKQRIILQIFPEMIFLFLGFFCLLAFMKKDLFRWGGLALLFGAFCWIYVTWIPLLLAFLYAGFLFFTGRFFREFLFRIKLQMSIFLDFLIGISVMISLFCLLSAFSAGSITNLRIATIFFALMELFYYGMGKKIKNKKTSEKGKHQKKGKGVLKEFNQLVETKPQAACFSAALMFFCVQIGRMNKSIDYDSIWYGLRSEYVLNPGNGIYENLNLVGAVYTYPKGFETLLLPISGLPSYAFIYAFNICLTFFCMIIGYRMVKMFCGNSQKTMPMFAVMLLSATPSIMNMAITAKTDTITMMMQLLILYFFILYLRTGERFLMTGAWSAYFLSLIFKPTSLVFSTAIMGMSILYLLWERWKNRRSFFKQSFESKKMDQRDRIKKWLLLLPVFGAVTGITMRTYLIVGVPMTSSLGPFFEKIGFHVKYPYRVDQFNQVGNNVSFFTKEGIGKLLERYFGMFVAPFSENMNHVVIAWGSVAVTFLLAAMLCFLFLKKEKKQKVLGKTYLTVVFLPFLVVNIIIMGILKKPDGNYFMTFYAFVILYFCILLLEQREEIQKKISQGLMPFVGYGLILCVITSWSMCVGMNETHLFSRQYYQSQLIEKVYYQQRGMNRIWDYLEEHSNEKIIGFGDHEQILRLPGIMQSYLDLTYWGNNHLTDTTEEFIEFIRRAGISYFVIDDEFEKANCPFELERLDELMKRRIIENFIVEGRYRLVKVLQ